MGRVLLLLVLALLVALTVPSSRAVVVDRAQPLLNPAYGWMTGQELNQMVDDLEFHQETRGALPLRRGEFDAWLDDRYPQARSRVDSWDTRYRFEVVGNRFRVISAGPDREFGTDDDIAREGTYNRNRR